MENFISSASILTVLSLHLHEVLFKVIEHFSLLLVFYVVVWGDCVVKLHAAFIKTLITEKMFLSNFSYYSISADGKCDGVMES